MDNRITTIANQLALKFTDELDIPSRFKNDTKTERKKSNLNSKVEQRFQKKVEDWKNLIDIMLSKIDNDKAWRYLLINPNIEDNLETVTKSKDFSDFLDYLVLRRDLENCDSDELGNLCMLHTEFQREIERKIEKKEKASA
jgi:hypothetical protein